MHTANASNAGLSRAIAFFETAEHGIFLTVLVLIVAYGMVDDYEHSTKCLAKLAFLLNETGDIQGRDAASRRFCEIMEQMDRDTSF